MYSFYNDIVKFLGASRAHMLTLEAVEKFLDNFLPSLIVSGSELIDVLI